MRNSVTTWRAVGLLPLTLALLAGCTDGPPPDDRRAVVASAPAALGGATVSEVDYSRAERIDTAVGIAGTVGFVASIVSQTDTETTWHVQCSVTLVGRNKVLTGRHCVQDWDDTVGFFERDPATLAVGFTLAGFESGTNFPVQSLVTWDPMGLTDYHGFAVLTLETSVPTSLVQNVAPVYFGDVSQLLDETAVVAGFGSTCMGLGCNDAGTRRVGSISSPFDLTDENNYHFGPRIEAILNPAVDAVPYSLDWGGPLFFKDPVSRRFVLAGISWYQQGDWVGHYWTYLGNAGDGIPAHDHAPALQAQLGPDADGDGIPDASDNCAPATCAQYGLPAFECSNPTQADSDGDRLGNACCFTDPRASLRNSNVDAEEALGADPKPDACDAAPLLRIASRAPTMEDVFGRDPQRIYFKGESWVGDGADLRSFEEDIAFRYCGCYDLDGNPVSESNCTVTCDGGDAVNGHFSFSAIEPDWEPSFWQKIPVPGTGGLPQAFAEGRPGAMRNFSWHWYADAETGSIGSHERQGELSYGTRGFLASAVVKTGDFYSSRDSTYGGNLRAVLQFESVPNVSKFPIGLLDPPHLVGLDPCFTDPFGCHGAFIPPWEIWLEQISGVPNLADGPLLVQLDPDNGHEPFAMAWWDSPYRIDFGSALTDTSAWTFPDADTPWHSISPLEPMASLRDLGSSARAMRVAPSHIDSDLAFLVYADATGLQIAEPWSGAGLAAAVATTSTSPMAPVGALAEPKNRVVHLPEGGTALFSASRRSLLLIGGADNDSQARIRRYDVDTHELEILGVNPAFEPSRLVLGAAYDYVDDLLYVLDVVAESARLVEHELETNNSRVLWSTSYNDTYASTYLGQAEDGQLVLAVTDTESYTAWSIDVKGEEARFTGRIDGKGAPVTAPVMGAYSLTMPVLQSDGLHYVELAAGRFIEGEACGGL